MRYQHRLKVLQEGEGWLRQELACIGLELRKEQLQELYHTQQLALRRYEWVETKEDRLFDILTPFLKSPTMALQTYMVQFKQAIWLYYHVRSHVDWHVSMRSCVKYYMKNIFFITGKLTASSPYASYGAYIR